MCDTCRAVGYWFPTGAECVDCGGPVSRLDAREARADGYVHGDVCHRCRASAAATLALLRGEETGD